MAADSPVTAANVLDLASTAIPLQPTALFGRACPLEVELGSGKGRFLIEWAALHPERCLLGVERAQKYVAMAAARAARRGLANLLLVRTTAEDALFRCLRPESAAAIHVYFPDPWPKKRHRKRRLFNPASVLRMAEVLAPGGVLRVKTDHLEYGGEIEQLLNACALLARAPVESAFAGVPETSFEAKYARQGRPFVRLAFCRTG